MGVATLLAFGCIMRIGEVLNLKWCDIFLPPAGALEQVGSIFVASSKRGGADHVPIYDTAIIRMLRLFRGSAWNLSSRVFSFGYQKYRKIFLAVLEVLQLSKARCRSHSLRRGGAMRLLMNLIDVDAIMTIGRWSSIKSCRLYLKVGEALLGQVKASMTAQEELKWSAFVDECTHLFTY